MTRRQRRAGTRGGLRPKRRRAARTSAGGRGRVHAQPGVWRRGGRHLEAVAGGEDGGLLHRLVPDERRRRLVPLSLGDRELLAHLDRRRLVREPNHQRLSKGLRPLALRRCSRRRHRSLCRGARLLHRLGPRRCSGHHGCFARLRRCEQEGTEGGLVLRCATRATTPRAVDPATTHRNRSRLLGWLVRTGAARSNGARGARGGRDSKLHAPRPREERDRQ